MKSLITTLITIGLLAPAGATYAFSIGELIEAAKSGNGIYVESHSSVSTGGQTVQSGENMQTGDAHASSYSEINVNGGEGSVKVKVETNENGNSETKEFTQPVENGAVKVEAQAEVKNGESTSEVKVNDAPVTAGTTSALSHTAPTSSVSVAHESKLSLLFSTKLPNFFKTVLSFFTWF